MKLKIMESKRSHHKGGVSMGDYLHEYLFNDKKYDVFNDIKICMKNEFNKSKLADLNYRFIEINNWYTKIRIIRKDTYESLLFTVEYKDVYDGLIYATCNYRIGAGNKENVFSSAKEFVDWMLGIVDARLF